MKTGTMEKLSRLPNVIGVKEASGSVGQARDVIQRIQNRKEDFTVLSGADILTLPMMALGGKGVISVASNLVPDRVISMVESALSGDFTEARRKHFRPLPLFKAVFLETNPVPIKEAMNLCGMAAGACRLPLTPLRESSRERLLKEVLKALELLGG